MQQAEKGRNGETNISDKTLVEDDSKGSVGLPSSFAQPLIFQGNSQV